MKLIVGLGNPGKEYKNTRHNIGFLILNNILSEVKWNKSSKANTLFYKDSIGEEVIEYLKPQTFMNDSGISVSYAQKKHRIKSENIIIIHDDIDLSVGRVKISYDRGDGGHNGIKSIMNHLGSQSFIRIRVGVSILDENQIIRKPNVLGKFSKNEIDIINKNISLLVKDIINSLVVEGREIAMNKFN